MSTFADMATLLMSFFVLLLAFSEMDVVKYKAISGSMKKALGVKADSYEITLPEGPPAENADLRGEQKPRESEEEGNAEKKKGAELSPEADLIRRKLAAEIKEKKIIVETLKDRIIIRIPEQGVFPSGSATMANDFVPVLVKVREALSETDGAVIVAGHTDDIPISNRRFRSNWDLSAARAASVVHLLLSEPGIIPQRVVAQGYAETRPLVENVDAETRARNRRVDVILSTRERVPPGTELDTGEPAEDGSAPAGGGGGGAGGAGEGGEASEGGGEPDG